MATIAENLARIQQAKADIKTAIEAKGVTVPSSATIDTYDDYVSEISGGGGNPILKSIEVEDFTGTTFNAVKSYITSLTIPSGVTSIEGYAFDGCRSLTSIEIPSGVTSIGDYAFQNCTSLTSIEIPSGVTSIGEMAFQTCSGLTTINIPSGVTTIGVGTFQNCHSLTNIDIPSGVTSIGSSAFRYCISLTSMTINATTPPTLANTNALQNTNNCPIYVPSESVEAYKAANNWSTYADRIQAIPNN